MRSRIVCVVKDQEVFQGSDDIVAIATLFVDHEKVLNFKGKDRVGVILWVNKDCF